MRFMPLILCGLLLTGCTGAQLPLPAISDVDIARAKIAMDARPVNLTEYYRTDEQAASLVSTIGNSLKLAATRTCKRLDFSPCVFHVNYLPDDTINAYADDTTVYIHRGLIRYLSSDAEIAAVIGHEMGHVMAEHYEETQQNQMIGALIGGLLVGGLMAGTGYYGSPGYDPQVSQDILEGGMRLGGGVGVLSFSKDQEREADLISAYLLADAGYDLPTAGRVFEVLTALGDGELKAGLLDSHPVGPERAASWSRAVAGLTPRVPAATATLPASLPNASDSSVSKQLEQQPSNGCTWNSAKYRYECWDFQEADATATASPPTQTDPKPTAASPPDVVSYF